VRKSTSSVLPRSCGAHYTRLRSSDGTKASKSSFEPDAKSAERTLSPPSLLTAGPSADRPTVQGECPAAQPRHTRDYASLRISVEACEAIGIAYQGVEHWASSFLMLRLRVVAPCHMPLMFGAHRCHLEYQTPNTITMRCPACGHRGPGARQGRNHTKHLTSGGCFVT